MSLIHSLPLDRNGLRCGQKIGVFTRWDSRPKLTKKVLAEHRSNDKSARPCPRCWKNQRKGEAE